MSSAAPLLAPGARVGRYVVVEVLGRGATGEMYAARDPELDRKVALKLLHREDDAEGPARLLREAQALARLSHPNVVAVYDVGTLGERVFIATELIDGGTLTQWLAAAPRPLARVLEAFRQAGRGLAAAHAAGLVHRDFKPDNVLVSRDGRVCVADFGLARADRDAVPPPGGDAADGPLLDVRLTRTGHAHGTPAYMAPEQHLGAPVDARADQFAFCVALYEAVCGVRPFAGDTVEAVRAAALRGAVAAPAPGRRVPTWLLRALERGLSSQPRRRFPDMAALLDAISEAPARRRRRLLAAAALGLTVALAGGGAALWRGRGARTCAALEAEANGAWPAGARDALRRRFAEAPGAGGVEAFAQLEAGFDTWREGLRRSVGTACEARPPRGDAAQFDARVACLEDALGAFRALWGALDGADGPALASAAQAVAELPLGERCLEAEPGRPLRAPAPPALAQARALTALSRYAEAAALATQVAEASAGDEAARADALLLRGEASMRLAQYEGAQAALTQALHVAEGAGLERVAARAWVTRARLEAQWLVRPEAALESAGHAAALTRHAGGDEEVEALAAGARGIALNALGRYDDAVAELTRAAALESRLLGPTHPTHARTLTTLGNALLAAGDVEAARARYVEALAVREQVLPPGHPERAVSLNNLGRALLRLEDAAGARQKHEAALAIHRAAQGDAHPEVARTLALLAACDTAQGAPAQALERLQQALTLARAALPAGHPLRLPMLLDTADAARAVGDAATAVALRREALAHVEAAAPPKSAREVAAMKVRLAEDLRAAGEDAEATALAAAALQVLTDEADPWRTRATAVQQRPGALGGR